MGWGIQSDLFEDLLKDLLVKRVIELHKQGLSDKEIWSAMTHKRQWPGPGGVMGFIRRTTEQYDNDPQTKGDE